MQKRCHFKFMSNFYDTFIVIDCHWHNHTKSKSGQISYVAISCHNLSCNNFSTHNCNDRQEMLIFVIRTPVSHYDVL